MKRFVTYLYECERGNKTKNVGFIRVNVRGEETTMEVYIRNVGRAADVGKLFILTEQKNSEQEELFGIELAEISITNGQSDTQIAIERALSDIAGVGIRFDSGLYIASCWKDEQADEIVRGEFVLETTLVVAEEPECEVEMVYEQEKSSEKEDLIYERIDLSQIRDLPSPNWHLATNSFLVHGFWNYGYLVLKKEVEEDKEMVSLGVPGIFEKPEAVMAVLFGFPNFEMVPETVVAEQKEKNQETEEGTFGCWFVNLKM